MSFTPKTKDGLRILYHANAPWARTGYGVQSNSLLPRLAKLPEVDEIALLAYYGIAGGESEQEIGFEVPVDHIKVKCFPARSDPWGNDVVGDHVTSFDADIVITLFDLWPLAPDFGWRGARWLPWFPVDHEPIPPQVLERTAVTYDNLVYSKSAAEELNKRGVRYTYIPHGVETTLYKPLSLEERRKAKKYLGFPEDCFLIGTVGANKGFPPRKGWNEMYLAISEFIERCPSPERVQFYQHSLCTGEHGGPDLMQMASDFGLSEKIRFPNTYMLQSSGYTMEQMNLIYNAMDVFILLSRGEGFGLPILEAQACGVPVVVTDWTACRELSEAGFRVPLAHREWTPQRSFWGIANPSKAADSLLEVYHRFLSEEQGWGNEFSKLRHKAREFALPYDWQSLVDNHWKPFIERLWSEVKPRIWGPMMFPDPIIEEEEEEKEEFVAVREIGGNGTGYRPELVSTPD